MADVDMDKLHQFVGQMLGDLGGAASVALVHIGDARPATETPFNMILEARP